MKTEALRAARRSNLSTAIKAFEIPKAHLGEAMGWSDGSFVGQLERGRRAITEELARQLEDAFRKMAHPVDPGDLDLPPLQFQRKHLGGYDDKASPEERAAESAAAALAVLAAELKRQKVTVTPKKLAEVTKTVAEATQTLGSLDASQIRHILRSKL